MKRLLRHSYLVFLLALSACQPALHGVSSGPDADALLCRRLVQAYQAGDWESLPQLAPRSKDLKAILNETRSRQPDAGVKPNGPPPQKKLEREMIAMAQACLDSAGVAPKDLQFVKVEHASTISTGQSPVAYRQDWLVMRGPSGTHRQQVFVIEFEGRAYLASLGAINRSEE